MRVSKTDKTVKKINHTGLPSKDENLLNVFGLFSFIILDICLRRYVT